MTKHVLKTHPEFWDDLESRRKTFEIRCTDDRDFQVGDILHLREWDPNIRTPEGEKWTKKVGYTGREMTRRITYVLSGEKWGLHPAYAVLALGE